ncbi:MAG: hypothetical protein Q7S68_03995 [Deltaproteobacteria bacterium]|nr:hypothetical protein [Deltaproteobacteria bacterium]
MATTRPDSPLQRLFYNQIAEQNRVGFRFTPEDQGAPGIDAADISFDNYQEAQQTYKVRLDTNKNPLSISSQLRTVLDRIQETVASKRQEWVAQAVAPDFVFKIPSETDPAKLGLKGSYKKAFQHLWNIAKYTEALRFLAEDLASFSYYRTIQKHGSASDQRLYLHQGHLRNCGPFDVNSFCTPHPFFLVPDPNGTAWPDNFGTQEYETLGERGWTAGVLEGVQSHYTVKMRTGESLESVPFTEFAPYKEWLLKIAAEFESIAALRDIDEPLREAALAYARACRGKGKNPNRPFDEAEQVWATNPAKKLSFTFGPLEEMGFGQVRSWQMTIDLVREEETKEMKKDRHVVSLLNQHFNEQGLEIPTKESPERPVVVSDTVYSNLRFDGGYATVDTQSIPNDGPVVQTFGRRTNLSANVTEAIYEQILIPIRDRIIAPHLRKYMTPGMLTKFRELHGLAHDFGFEPDYQNQCEKEEGRIFDRLGKWYWLLDEAKANAGALVGSRLLEEAGDVRYDIQQQVQMYLTYVAYLIYHLRQAPNSSRRESARAKLGWFFSTGALTIKSVEEGGVTKRYLNIDTSKIMREMEHFTYDLLQVQRGGDPLQAETFMHRYDSDIPFEFMQWVSYEKRGPQGRLNDVPVYVALEQPDLLGPLLSK